MVVGGRGDAYLAGGRFTCDVSGTDVTRLGPMEAVDIRGRGIDYRITNVGPVPGSEAFLLESDDGVLLYDSGYGFCGPALVGNIRRALGSRGLDCILITHSHYDHILGSAHCVREWPDAEVVASRHTFEVIARESARRTMRGMDASAAELHGFTEYEDLTDSLRVDRIVTEGDRVEAGGLGFVVHEYPGHTLCSIGFHCPDERLLLSCETLGLYVGEGAMSPTYLVGYGMTLNSIDRAMGLDVDVMLLPHAGVATGRCRDLLESSRRAAVSWAEEIMEADRRGEGIEGILGMMKRNHYTGYVRGIQPEAAFDLNARYMIPMIIRELGQSRFRMARYPSERTALFCIASGKGSGSRSDGRRMSPDAGAGLEKPRPGQGMV